MDNLAAARATLAPWAAKTVFLKNSTREAVSLVTQLADFIYVDARHDYCGVAEDLADWWPKLRPGGILAGHDYLHAGEAWPSGQDWSRCLDGSENKGAVVGAVNEFVMAHGLQLSLTYAEDHIWRSWLVRKPSV